MKIQRLSLVLTVLNFGILLVTLALFRPAAAQDVAPVLRARGLEIVDAQGKMRAQIVVEPAAVLKDGSKYPDTVIFRLIDPNGRPGFKGATSIEGTGLVLTVDSKEAGWSGVQLIAERPRNWVKVKGQDGREQIVRP